MNFNIQIGGDESFSLSLELIPNPDGMIPFDKYGSLAEWCQTCGRDNVDKFWTGKEMICIECAKSSRVRKRVGITFEDNISVEELFSRLRAREEVYGSLEEFIRRLK